MAERAACHAASESPVSWQLGGCELRFETLQPGVPVENCLIEGFTLAGFEFDCAHKRDKHGGLKSASFRALRFCVKSSFPTRVQNIAMSITNGHRASGTKLDSLDIGGEPSASKASQK
jgi:hypothetical protein